MNKYMNRQCALFLALMVLTVSGCAWQRIPVAPEYILESPIPLKVGVILADNQASVSYGLAAIKGWNEMRLFDSLVYPYRDGDPVNAIMRVDITGDWKGSGVGAGIITGLTFGLAGTVIGPSMTGTHDALAVLNKSSDEIGRYSVHVTSTVEWGMLANTSEVAKQAEELQRKQIAYELAKKIRADRQVLLSKFGKTTSILIHQDRVKSAEEKISVLQEEWKQKNDKYALSDGQRVFAKDYNKVFSSVVTALSGLGLPVKNMERQSGYIFAEGNSPLPPEKAREIGQEAANLLSETTGLNHVYSPGLYTYAVTTIVSQISPTSTSVKMRLSFTANVATRPKLTEVYPRAYSETQRYIWEKLDGQIFLDEHIDK